MRKDVFDKGVCPACVNPVEAPVSREVPDDWPQTVAAAYQAGRSHNGPAPAAVSCARCGQNVPPEVRAAQEQAGIGRN